MGDTWLFCTPSTIWDGEVRVLTRAVIEGSPPAGTRLVQPGSVPFPQQDQMSPRRTQCCKEGRKIRLEARRTDLCFCRTVGQLLAMACQTWQTSPEVTDFYIPLGSRKSSKAFKFCFPSSAPLGRKITQSKGLLCFAQAWEQLTIFLQNPPSNFFLLPPGRVCLSLVCVCSRSDEGWPSLGGLFRVRPLLYNSH